MPTQQREDMWRPVDLVASIWDASKVTKFDVSSDAIRELARGPPILPSSFMRIIVVPQEYLYGMMRMFQILSEEARPELRRTMCFGTCPSYSLTVSGDRSVVYNGDAYVQYCGEFRGHVAQEAVRQLVQLFKRADYFNTFDRYAMGMTDGRLSPLPSRSTTKANQSPTIGGLWVGMPESVMDIEDGLDHLAGPKVWAKAADANGNVNYRCHR